MVGRVALTPEQALAIKKSGKKVILFSGKPQDEDVYWLTVGRNLDGIALTFGAGKSSHITSFAQANAIPLVASLRSIVILPEGIKIGDRTLKVGDRVAINGNGGELYAVSEQEQEPIIEDKTVLALSYGINYVELLRSMRNRYQSYDYEELLASHAEGVKEFGRLPSNIPKDQIVGLQARIHCLHLLAYEKGKKHYGDNYRGRVDLDVAVADGSFNRVQGLEDKNFLIEEQTGRDAGKYLIITGGNGWMRLIIISLIRKGLSTCTG